MCTSACTRTQTFIVKDRETDTRVRTRATVHKRRGGTDAHASTHARTHTHTHTHKHTQQVWDTLFLEGYKIIFRIGLAVLQMYEKQVCLCVCVCVCLCVHVCLVSVFCIDIRKAGVFVCGWGRGLGLFTYVLVCVWRGRRGRRTPLPLETLSCVPAASILSSLFPIPIS